MACPVGLETALTQPTPRFTSLIEWATGRTFTGITRALVILLELVLFMVLAVGVMLGLPLLIPDIAERPMLRGGINLVVIFLWSLLYAKAQKRRL